MKVAVPYRSLRHETAGAYLLRVTQTREVWVPKSAVTLRDRPGVKPVAIMPQSLAEEKALGYRLVRHIPIPLKPERKDVIDELKYE